MKIISLYIALSCATGCKGQTATKQDTIITVNKIQMERPTITDESEKLDLNYFKDNLIVEKKNKEVDNNKWKEVDFLYSVKKDSIGTRWIEGIEEQGFNIRFFSKPKNSYYSVFKLFDGKTKYITRKRVDFELSNSTIAVGKEYFYNEQGKLTKTVDHDLGWDFSVEKVVQFALDNGFELPKPGVINQVQIIKQENKEKRKYWILDRETHGKSGKGGYETYKLDAKTGEILFHSETDGRIHDDRTSPPETIIVPDKTLKSRRVVHKTYQGKDYTESEWKAFEQEQYNEHLRKTGRGDLVKPTETPKAENKKSFIANEDDVKPKKKGFWG